MSERPAPLVPANVDLRGYEFMPLYGDRLFGSETWMECSPEAKIAALRLWWRAYAHELPAGSLPNKDVLICQYAGYEANPRAWAKLRPQAMRGWVLCSDNRWYHPMVSQLAIEAFEYREAQRDKTKKAREARLLRNLSQKENAATNPSVTESTGQDRTGQDIKNLDSATPSIPKRPPAAPPPDERAGWAGECCQALKRYGGVTAVNPSHPDLLALHGHATPQGFADLAASIKAGHGVKPMAYHLSAMRRQLAEVQGTPTASQTVARKGNIHDQRKAALDALTGKNRRSDERDITPDSAVVD